MTGQRWSPPERTPVVMGQAELEVDPAAGPFVAGTPTRDATVLPDGALLTEPPSNLPAVVAIESTNDTDQPIVSVRCPRGHGRLHHFGRTALPAVRYCALGPFAITKGE